MTLHTVILRNRRTPCNGGGSLFRFSYLLLSGCITLCSVLLLNGCTSGRKQPLSYPSGHLEWDTRWENASVLNHRPADKRAVSINPPRFSWAYLAEGRPAGPRWANPKTNLPNASLQRSPNPPLTQFRFQIASNSAFHDPIVDVVTEINFYNALSPLSSGTWHWRVGRLSRDAEWRWEASRSFYITSTTPTWDRSVITAAAEQIARLPYPRIGPHDRNWRGLAEQLKKRDPGVRWLKGVEVEANLALESDWWSEGLPEHDTPQAGMSRQEQLFFAQVARGIAATAWMGKLTGHTAYLPAKEHLLAFCRYEKGGRSSPEFHGSRIKFTTEIIKHLAMAYDALHDDLKPEERQQVLQALEWRVHAVWFESMTWSDDNAGTLHADGIGIQGNSHPFQNLCWTLPGLIILAGQSDHADRALGIALNFLAGVGSVEGPDEGYNAGPGYGNEKGWAMLEAMGYVDRVLPELELGRSPQVRRLGDWYRHLFRPGLQLWPFGDQHGDAHHLQRTQMINFLKLGVLTERPEDFARFRALNSYRYSRMHPNRALYEDLVPLSRIRIPEHLEYPNEENSLLFPIAGWVMVSNVPPSDWKQFRDATGMIFTSRPKGISTHSYRAENSFMWYSHGEVLSGGGGIRKYSSNYSRSTEAHNTILIDGEGQDYEPLTLPPPGWAGRISSYRETDEFIHWVGDASPAYHTHGEGIRVLRHVVFLKSASSFILYDDLHRTLPATWTWAITLRKASGLQRIPNGYQYQVGEVTAQILFASSPSLDLHDEGPVETESHRLRVRNRVPASHHSFLSVLQAWREQPVDTAVLHEKGVRIHRPGSVPVTVSFDPDTPGDITIHPELFRP